MISKKKFYLLIGLLTILSFILESQEIRLGSSSDDVITGVGYDKNGNIFIAGYTSSKNFPVTKNSYDPSYNGKSDIFLCKFNNNMSKLLAATYIGGSDKEHSGSLAINKNGDVYISGYTRSSDFIKKKNGFDSSLGGKSDHFILKISNDLNKVNAFTYIGGSRTEGAHYFNLTLDSDSNVLMNGITNSRDFPLTKESYDSVIDGPNDLYIAKFSPDLKRLLASTLLGGNQWEATTGIKVNKKGSIYVAGHTASTNFPCTSHAFDKTFDGVRDIFISKFNKDLSKLESSTLISGNEYDCGYCWNLDKNGNVLAGGMTCSKDFYTTKDAYSRKIKKGKDVDINLTIMNPDLSGVLHSTLLGGRGSADDVVRLNDGRILIVGFAFGDIDSINVGDDLQYHGGASDGFIAILNSTLNKCLFLGYLGGDKYDTANKVLQLPDDKILIVGTTQSQKIKNEGKTFGTKGGADVFLKIIDLKDNKIFKK